MDEAAAPSRTGKPEPVAEAAGSKTSTVAESSSTTGIDPAKLTDIELLPLLQKHFKHTAFKSKLQQEAIKTVLKRKSTELPQMAFGVVNA